MGRKILMILILNYVRGILMVDPVFYTPVLFFMIRAYQSYPVFNDSDPSDETPHVFSDVPCNCLTHRLFGHKVAA